MTVGQGSEYAQNINRNILNMKHNNKIAAFKYIYVVYIQQIFTG